MDLPKEFENRHPSTISIFRFFAYDHLPEPLKTISKIMYGTAYQMIYGLPDSPELTVGLRKLLEAKDCFVRSGLDLKKVDLPNTQRSQQTSESDSELSTKDTDS